MTDAWKAYAADFNAMTDEEVEAERAAAQNMIDENESWVEAVAAWVAAGRPREDIEPTEAEQGLIPIPEGYAEQ